MIGAILESTGYHYQSAILDAMQNPFQNEVGGLVYLVGIVLALVAYSTRGGFSMASWLLIGPPLFFATVLDREPIPNARWEFGLQGRLQAPVDDGVRQLYRGGTTDANVSKVFSRYVQMISTTTKTIVAEISRGREGADLWFILKGQLFGMMHTPGVEDVHLQHLIHNSLLLGCGQLIRYAQAMNNPIFRLNDPSVRAYEQRPEFVQARNFFLPTRDYARQRFLELYRVPISNLDRHTARYIAELELQESAQNAGNILAGLTGAAGGNPFSAAAGAAGNNAGGGAVPITEDQIDQRMTQIRNSAINCFDIWRWTSMAINRDSRRAQQRLNNLAARNLIEPAVLQNLQLQAQGVRSNLPITYVPSLNILGFQTPEIPINQTITAQDITTITSIISRYYLRNENNRLDRGSVVSWFASRHELRSLGLRLEGQNSFTEQARNAIREFSEKERLIHTASAMPYYQGLALYFLGIFFPFFALLLLIPGKWGGFALWFLLWLWIKSWDIGFAVVMLLDDLFFAIFAIERQARGGVQQIPLSGGAQSELQVAAAALREVDPTFQLSTYYTLMSICVIAIPPVTSQIFFGVAREGVSIIAEGVKGFAKHYADSALQRSTKQAQDVIKEDIQQQVRQRARAYQFNYMRNQALSHGSPPEQRTGNAILPSVPVISGAGVSQNGQNVPMVPLHHPGLQGGANWQGAAALQANQAGYAEGRMIGHRAYTPLGSDASGILRGLNWLHSGPEARIGLARFQNMANLTSNEQAYVAARAWWDADASQSIAALYELAAISGSMPLPWSNFVQDDPWVANFNLQIARRQAEYAEMVAVNRVSQEGVVLLLTVAQRVLQLPNRPTLTEVQALRGDRRTSVFRAFAQEFLGVNAQGQFANPQGQLNPIRLVSTAGPSAGAVWLTLNNPQDVVNFGRQVVNAAHPQLNGPGNPLGAPGGLSVAPGFFADGPAGLGPVDPRNRNLFIPD